jgi:mono/diheme cytochrome c family protein
MRKTLFPGALFLGAVSQRALFLGATMLLLACGQGDGGAGDAPAATATATAKAKALPGDKSIDDGIDHGPGPYDGPKATNTPPPGSGPMGGPMAGGPMAGGPGGDGMTALTDWIRGAYVKASVGDPPEFDDAMRSKGAELFSELCASCHGADGDGKGKEADKLNPKPRDLTLGVYKLRSTPSGKLPTSGDIFLSITRGIHGTAMVPFVPLPESERWALVAHLRSLSPRFAKAKKPPTPIEVPDAPDFSDELVTKGKALFAKAGCVDCHGEAGKGDGKRAGELKDAAGDPIAVRDLTAGRFRRGTTMPELFLTLRTGLDGTPMAAFEAFTDEDIWALSAFVKSIVDEQVHKQDNPPVHPEERLGLRTSMRSIMSH